MGESSLTMILIQNLLNYSPSDRSSNLSQFSSNSTVPITRNNFTLKRPSQLYKSPPIRFIPMV